MKYLAIFFIFIIFCATLDLVNWELFGMKMNYIFAFCITFYFGQWFNEPEDQEYF